MSKEERGRGGRGGSDWLPAARSQASAGRRRHKLVAILLPILLLAAVSLGAELRAPSSQQQGTLEGDEVNLIKPQQNQSQQPARPTHLYRLRTGPMNGRLTLAAPSANNSATSNSKSCHESDHEEEAHHQLAAMSPSLRLISGEPPSSSLLLRQLEEPGEQQKVADANSKPADLQQQAPLGDSILSLIDDYDSKIVTNRTKAQLSCDSGEMVLRLNFSDPFKGIVYPDHNRLSPCRFFGDGHQNYELRLPLRGCGTRQVSPRVFINDVIVRFHKTLELEEDEVKTLICRYPPPLAPVPLDGPSSPPPSSNEQEQQDDVKSQFELINGNGGDRRLGNSNVETQSDNLVVAPTGGGPRTPSDLLHPRHSGNLLLEPSQTRPGGGGLLGPSSTSTSANLLERLSSIELLFLTSALMFLVLLALALATSYYCFRRQQARGSKRRASAILGARRLARSPLIVGNHVGAQHHHHRQPQPYYARPPPILYHSQQQLQHQQPSHSQPSSPESDLSGRGLLASSQSLGADKSALKQLYAGHLNAGFAPDMAQQQTPYASSLAAVYGRRDHLASTGNANATGGRRSAAGPHYLARQRPAPERQLLSARGPHYAAHLMRAKSLSSMEHQQHQQHLSHRQQRHAWPLEHNLENDDHLRHKQSNYRKRQRRLEQVASSQVHTFSSESDDLDEANRLADGHKTSASILRAQKPKIVLKSIEDSYITNLTEIHQQEYLKRDSTRPLSLAKWRSMQSTRLGGNAKQQDDSAWSPHSSTPPPAPNTVQTLSPDPSKQYNTVDSRYANLRSLTELDVDFARAAQQVQPNPDASSNDARRVLRPTASMGHLAGNEHDDGKEDDDDDDEEEEETHRSHWRRPNRGSTVITDAANKTTTGQSLVRQRRWSSSVPSVIVPDVDQHHDSQREQAATGASSKSLLQPQSPDLIISPDYDLTTTRLELEPTNSSHNSVSYV